MTMRWYCLGELSSRTLSYIQLALDCMEKHAGSGAFVYDLQPVLG